jgi:hypothetical protein
MEHYDEMVAGQSDASRRDRPARFCSVLLTLWPDHRDGLIYQISQFDMRKHINIIVSLPLGVSIFRQYDIRVSE